MRQIVNFKVKLAPGSQEIGIPKNSELLTVLGIRGDCFLYAIVDTDNIVETRTFHVYQSRDPLPEIDLLHQSRKYLGTIIQADFYVWHVFEIV